MTKIGLDGHDRGVGLSSLATDHLIVPKLMAAWPTRASVM
jgi:hypothetical protein